MIVLDELRLDPDLLELNHRVCLHKKSPSISENLRFDDVTIRECGFYFFEGHILFYKSHEIFPVSIFHHRFRECLELHLSDPTSTIGDLLGTTDLESLPLLDDRDEVRSIHHALMRPSIEPRISTIHDLDLELTTVEELFIHRGNLILSPIALLYILRDLDDIIGIEIESYDCKIGLWELGLLLYGDDLMGSVELDHTVPLWI